MHITKLLALFIALSTCTMLFGADLKESVAVVRHDNKTIDSLYNQLGTTLQNSGFISAGKSLRSYSNSFGSGFVYKANSGNTYVITNYHVVGNNTSALLQLQVQGKDTTFFNCPILYTCPKTDIAIIQAPKSIINKAITAYTSNIEEGREVFSAGFPGLGDTPLWQLGKGVISNKEVNSGLLGNKDSLIIIQHTAQVDGGNSGGPLLVKSNENDSIYQVIGVNTWKGRLRENTNFSVRLSDVEDIINMYETNKQIDIAPFDSIHKEFTNDIQKGYTDFAKYVSMEYVLSLNNDEISYLLKNSEQSIYDAIRKNPIWGLKLMIANDIYNKIGKVKDITLSGIKQESETKYQTIYSIKKKTFQFNWQYTSLGWRIHSVNYSNVKDNNKKIKSENSHYGIRSSLYNQNIEVGLSFPIHETQNYGFNFGYNCSFYTYGLASANLDVNGYKVDDQYESWHPLYEGEKNKFGACVNFGAGAQLPVQLKQFMITPYALGIFGIGGYPDRYGSIIPICVGTRLGGKFGYLFSNDIQLYVALEYNYRYVVNGIEVADDFANHLLLKLGIEW